MNFDAWTSTGRDPVRRRRLLVGYVVGLVAVVVVSAFVVLTSKNAIANDDEEPVIEAQLATEPEPEPEPPPEPVAKPEPPKPPKPKLQAPVEVPKEPLKEAAANPAELAAEDDPFRRDEAEAAPEPAKPAVVEAPKPLPPKPAPRVEKKAPIRLTEDMTPPVPVGAQAKPEFPAEAKALNIEGIVIVKYVIAEDGSVRDVKALKGPPELHAACVAAVRTWRFQPIRVDGEAVAVTRVARFVMKIKT